MSVCPARGWLASTSTISSPMEVTRTIISFSPDTALKVSPTFTPQGGTIRVIIAPENGEVKVTVEDTGAGIAPEDLPHIFERFYKADKSRNRTVPGTGLGLAIAKEIVELHGGEIRAESSPGAGARLEFVLPVRT